jgi:hypothetical protein
VQERFFRRTMSLGLRDLDLEPKDPPLTGPEK